MQTTWQCLSSTLRLGTQLHLRMHPCLMSAGRFYVGFESLLSTHGGERGMLGDFSTAVELLQHVLIDVRVRSALQTANAHTVHAG